MPDATEMIPIFKRGATVEKGGRTVVIDSEFVASLLSDFEAAYGDKDYKPPILREHERDGLRYGKVLALKADQEYVYAMLQWNAEVADLRRSNLISEFSPAFGFATDAHVPNLTYQNLLAEVSFTSIPRQKNLPPVEPATFHEIPVTFSDIIEGGPMATEEVETQVEVEDLDTQDPINALTARLDALEALVQEQGQQEALSDEDTSPEASHEASKEDVDDVVADKAVALAEENLALRERVQALEAKALRSELEQKIVDLDDETFDHLSKLKEVDTTLFEKTVTTLSEVPRANSKGTTLNAPKGVSGGPQTRMTLAEAKKIAMEKDLRGAAKVDFLQEMGVL